MFLFKMFSRAWILTTLLVIAGTALCVRLGIWQLDRLAQRRAHNNQVFAMHAMPALDLNLEVPKDIAGMEWRTVQVTGEYDLTQQFALRNQTHGEEYGFHLITPLIFDSSTGSGQAGGAILVDRGFIPADGNDSPANWSRYDERGAVTVKGQIRLGDDVEIGGNPEAAHGGQDQLRFFNSIDVEKISAQLSYPVLPVFIQPNEDEADVAPPIPYQPELDLTEGSHFGYALQWFTFASILFFGYPFYLRKQLDAESKAS
jgi:surfeit locus 1 family protein